LATVWSPGVASALTVLVPPSATTGLAGVAPVVFAVGSLTAIGVAPVGVPPADAVAGLSLPGATILTLAGGFVFGAVPATLYVNIGATTGATLAFLAARYVLRDTVEQKFGRWLEPLQQGFAKNALSYLLTLRLIPLFPFFVVNLVSGLTRVSVGTYVAATALGIIPGSFVYAYAGRQLGVINSLKEIGSPQVLGAFVLLGAFALAPILYKKLSAKSA